MDDHKMMEPQPVAMKIFARMFGTAKPQHRERPKKLPRSHQKTSMEVSEVEESFPQEEHSFVTSREYFELLSKLSTLNNLIVEQQSVPGTDSMKESYIRLLQMQAKGIKDKVEAKCNKDLVTEKKNQYIVKNSLLKDTLREIKQCKSIMAIEGSKKSKSETNAIVHFFKGKPLNEKFEKASYKTGKYMNRIEDRHLEVQQECEDFIRDMTLLDFVPEETSVAGVCNNIEKQSSLTRMHENMLLSQLPKVPEHSLKDDDDNDNNNANTGSVSGCKSNEVVV